MTTTRREVLATALTAAGVAVTPPLAGVQPSDEASEHDHDHQAVPSDPALRTRALESVLVAKGLVDRAALDALVAWAHHGPPGARVAGVAVEWRPPLDDGRTQFDVVR